MSAPVSRVVQPGEGESYWQPVPANGFVEVAVAQGDGSGARFDTGIQEVAPGGHVRRHAHDVTRRTSVCSDIG